MSALDEARGALAHLETARLETAQAAALLVGDLHVLALASAMELAVLMGFVEVAVEKGIRVTVGPVDDLFVRGAQWVPIILFHAGLYLQDPEAGYAALGGGNPLFDAVPIDVIAGMFLAIEQVCVIGGLEVDDIEVLTREFSAALLGEGDPTPEGSAT